MLNYLKLFVTIICISRDIKSYVLFNELFTYSKTLLIENLLRNTQVWLYTFAVHESEYTSPIWIRSLYSKFKLRFAIGNKFWR